MESAAAAALPPPARVLVVGVAGPSGSGKSTVSRGLARALRSPFEPLNMDNWFVPDRMPPDTGSARGELNWETPEGVDAVGFLATVRRICADVAAFCQEARQRGATAAAASASWDADCPAALRSVPDARKRPRAVLRSDLASASDVPPPAATSTVVVVIEGFLLFYWPEVAAACDARLFMCPPHAVCRARRQQRSAWGRGEPEGFDAWYDRLVWPHFLKYLPTQLAHLADGCTLDAQSSDVDAIVRDATAFVARRCRLAGGPTDRSPTPGVATPSDPPRFHRPAGATPPRRVLVVGVAGASGSGKTTLARGLAAALGSPVQPISLDWFFDPAAMPAHADFGENWETPAGVAHDAMLAELASVRAQLLASPSAEPSPEAPPEPRPITVRRRHGGTRDIARPIGRRSQGSGSDAHADARGTVYVVIEGFLLFYWPEVAAACDARLFIEADQSTCRERRRAREAAAVPDADWARFFDGLVWPHFVAYRPTQLANLAVAGAGQSGGSGGVVTGPAAPSGCLDGALPPADVLAAALRVIGADDVAVAADGAVVTATTRRRPPVGVR